MLLVRKKINIVGRTQGWFQNIEFDFNPSFIGESLVQIKFKPIHQRVQVGNKVALHPDEATWFDY